MGRLHGMNQPRRGVTLIMVAAVLAILAALATGFYTMTLMQVRSATHYSDMVRAELLAKAGIEDAIARLRTESYLKTEDPTDPWFMVDYLHGAPKGVSFPASLPAPSTVTLPYSGALGNSADMASDRYSLSVSDSASKINVNAGDNLAVILDNLCRVIGPPLLPADMNMLQPRVWGSMPIGAGGDPLLFDKNPGDIQINQNLYFTMGTDGRPITATKDTQGPATYGDGYAIAGYRATHGRFNSLADVKSALTYVERSIPTNGIPDDPLEQLEIEVKFAALRDYITLDSWVDTSTVCVGKFEWVTTFTSGSGGYSIAIDRDKSWIQPLNPNNQPISDDAKAFKKDPNAFTNERGSLIGSYLSIVNGHGSGQLRIIVDNGIDWLRVEPPFVVDPGPVSSYMIVSREAAPYINSAGALASGLPTPLRGWTPTQMGDLLFPQTDANGNLVNNPNVDYAKRPLCIHRAPVNVNTASDKVLAALFLGIDIQHGHPMAVGTDADVNKLRSYPLKSRPGDLAPPMNSQPWTNTAPDWKIADYQIYPQLTVVAPAPITGVNINIPAIRNTEPYILTMKGMKRIPADSGMLVLDRPCPWAPSDESRFAYIYNYGLLSASSPYTRDTNFVQVYPGLVNEAHELAYRIIVARQRQVPVIGSPDPDPITADGLFPGYQRGPFTSWDDLYFRVIKPWDDIRSYPTNETVPNSGTPKKFGLGKASVARMIMAHFNSNTDILKFNPNIEWIDRWGRNFTAMEPVMVYTLDPELTSSTNYGHPSTVNVVTPTTFTNDAIPIFTGSSSPFLKEAGRVDGSYVIRSFRYKSDEMIDKTDMNRSTTEFSFDSNGIFEIDSAGQVSRHGELLSERKIHALVKVYDVWRESTQRQFVQGHIETGLSVGGIGSAGTSSSGRVARDAFNINSRLPLTTLPEPLVPLTYRLNDGGRNSEVVDPVGAHDIYGKHKNITTPDVVANRILPANYDGQIVLATNTASFDPVNDKDTFLASFNGDLDTDTSVGNGREQAKTPDDVKVRVVDTCGLLGMLNDTVIDQDPALIGNHPTYRFDEMNNALGGLDPHYYWNNVTVRMGDLRSDGVYLSSPGVSGNDGTLKYLFGDTGSKNFDTSSDSNTLSMWFKPTWRHDDYHLHELFNASNPGANNLARGCYLEKYGRYVWSYANSDLNTGWGNSANRYKINDLAFFIEGESMSNTVDNKGNPTTVAVTDLDAQGVLHGGYTMPPIPGAITPSVPDSPGFRIQPFRWSFSGARWCYKHKDPVYKGGPAGGADGPRGHWYSSVDDYLERSNVFLVTHVVRPFINTETYPEGPTWKPDLFWTFYSSNSPGLMTLPCQIGQVGPINAAGNYGQDVKWDWADGPPSTKKCFSINNLNYDQTLSIYRHLPCDGSFAVIDQLKISSQDVVLANSPSIPMNPPVSPTQSFTPAASVWKTDRIVREQGLSRYYLPDNPRLKGNCPTFTSQTLLQSLHGYDNSVANPIEYVTLVRLTWNAFTPRFMHENTQPTPEFTRTETFTFNGTNTRQVSVPFNGPFDFVIYNGEQNVDGSGVSDGPDVYTKVDSSSNRKNRYAAVERPAPFEYPGGQSHATQGIEVELMDGAVALTKGVTLDVTGAVKATNVQTFTDPDRINRLGDIDNPVVVHSDKLRYRVRFRYPVDPLVDPSNVPFDEAHRPTVDTTIVQPLGQPRHYLLDTPVFDDISITYFQKPRILAYQDVTE